MMKPINPWRNDDLMVGNLVTMDCVLNAIGYADHSIGGRHQHNCWRVALVSQLREKRICRVPLASCQWEVVRRQPSS
jgi:hypothetical protein